MYKQKKTSPLGKMIQATFTPPRKSDPFRKSRNTAKKLAKIYNIEIEPLKPGYNILPPAPIIDSEIDPFYGDHYAQDWDGVLENVQKYVEMLSAEKKREQVQP